MNKGILFFSAVAAIGTGFILGKKLVEKQPEAAAAVKQTCTEGFSKASLFCAGAVKAGSDKLTEIAQTLLDNGREKSELLAEKAKFSRQAIKAEIGNLKDMVTSINQKSADIDIYDDADMVFDENTEIFEMPEIGSEAL